MPIVAVTGTALRRIVVVAVMVIGLVAMHHLVATGCALAIGHHNASASTAHEAPGHLEAVSSPAGQVAEGMGATAPASAVVGFNFRSTEDDASDGSISVIACVAVLVMLLMLARAGRVSRVPRDAAAEWRGNVPSPESLVSRPPDLRSLSISRT